MALWIGGNFGVCGVLVCAASITTGIWLFLRHNFTQVVIAMSYTMYLFVAHAGDEWVKSM